MNFPKRGTMGNLVAWQAITFLVAVVIVCMAKANIFLGLILAVVVIGIVIFKTNLNNHKAFYLSYVVALAGYMYGLMIHRFFMPERSWSDVICYFVAGTLMAACSVLKGPKYARINKLPAWQVYVAMVVQAGLMILVTFKIV